MPIVLESPAPMLDEFIKSNRDEVISRARSRVAERPAPRPTEQAGCRIQLSESGDLGTPNLGWLASFEAATT
jgi:hypothetical protein